MAWKKVVEEKEKEKRNKKIKERGDKGKRVGRDDCTQKHLEKSKIHTHTHTHTHTYTRKLRITT